MRCIEAVSEQPEPLVQCPMRNDNNPYAPVVQQTIAPKTPRGFLPAAFWIFWASATLLFCALLLTPAIPAGVLGITSSIITLAYSLAYANHIVRYNVKIALNSCIATPFSLPSQTLH